MERTQREDVTDDELDEILNLRDFRSEETWFPDKTWHALHTGVVAVQRDMYLGMLAYLDRLAADQLHNRTPKLPSFLALLALLGAMETESERDYAAARLPPAALEKRRARASGASVQEAGLSHWRSEVRAFFSAPQPGVLGANLVLGADAGAGGGVDEAVLERLVLIGDQFGSHPLTLLRSGGTELSTLDDLFVCLTAQGSRRRRRRVRLGEYLVGPLSRLWEGPPDSICVTHDGLEEIMDLCPADGPQVRAYGGKGGRGDIKSA